MLLYSTLLNITCLYLSPMTWTWIFWVQVRLQVLLMFMYSSSFTMLETQYIFRKCFLFFPSFRFPWHTMAVSSLRGCFMCHSKLLPFQYHPFYKVTSSSYIFNFPTFLVINYGHPCCSSLQFLPPSDCVFNLIVM